MAAIVLGPLLFLGGLEAALRVLGYGRPTDFFLRRQVDGRPFLVTNPEFGKRFFPPGLARPPRPQAFPQVKPAGTRRVFVLGESAAMGDPDARFGLPRMLEVLLRNRFTNTPVEVVNAAVVAISSHVVRPIARECAAWGGDVWVVYMGNNEMIGPFGPISVFGWQAPPRAYVRATIALKSTRVGQAIDALTRTVARRGGELGEWGGMTMMAEQRLGPDDPRLPGVYANFESNLEDILAAAKRARATVVLCTVATNLKDCAPFASRHRSGLSASDLAAWEEHYRRGIDLESRDDFAGASEAYRQAAALDPEHAELCFRWAGCCQRRGQTEEAVRLWRRARDLDALPFRADGRINEVIRRVAARHASEGVQYLDVEALFAARSPEGAPGREFFYEHVHFHPTGNHLLATAVAERVASALDGRPPGAEGVGAPPWMPEGDCLQRLGFMEWNRHQILVDVLGRVRSPPFTFQAFHERDLRALEDRIDATRFATKPASVRRAVEQLGRLVASRPDETDLRWNHAELLEVDGARAAAEAEWRELALRLPLATVPNFNRARSLEASGRGEEAASVYRQCLAIDPDSSEARYRLGVLLGRLGQSEAGRRELRRAAAEKPRAVEVRLAYGDALVLAGAAAEARREFEAVLRLDPDNPAARARLEAR